MKKFTQRNGGKDKQKENQAKAIKQMKETIQDLKTKIETNTN